MTVTATTGVQHLEVVVIGGGQAGLAIGYFLAQQNRRFTILEAADEPAAAWRSRWDSLRLFTPVRYNSLPGLDFPGDPGSYPSRDDVIAYLSDYALPGAPRLRRRGTGPPPARCHRSPRPVLPRASVAAHPRLGAAGLGQGRRAVHRPAHRRVRPKPRHSVGSGALRSGFAITVAAAIFGALQP